jgi:hypothetical protein
LSTSGTDYTATLLGSVALASSNPADGLITLTLNASGRSALAALFGNASPPGFVLFITGAAGAGQPSFHTKDDSNAGLRPQLHVVYTATPTAPTLVSPISGSAASPVTFVWTPAVDASSRNVHFRIMVANSPATVNGDGSLASPLVDANTDGGSGFQYESSPGTWTAFPSGGLVAADQTKNVRYTASLSAGSKDWRVRQDAVA